MSAISRNWTRMAELSALNPRSRLQDAELHYRIAVQNKFANTGIIDPDFIDPEVCIK